jgi:hypothetical protein
MAHQTANKETMEAALLVLRIYLMMMMKDAARPRYQHCKVNRWQDLGGTAAEDAMNGEMQQGLAQAPFPWILSMQARKPRWRSRGHCRRRDGWLVARALKWDNDVLVLSSKSSTALFVSQGARIRKYF